MAFDGKESENSEEFQYRCSYVLAIGIELCDLNFRTTFFICIFMKKVAIY